MSQFKYNKALDHMIAAGLAYHQGDIKTAQAHLKASTECRSFASAVAIIQHNNGTAYAQLKRVQARKKQEAAAAQRQALAARGRRQQASFPTLAAEGEDEDDLGEEDEGDDGEEITANDDFNQEVLGEGEFEEGTGDADAPNDAFKAVASLNQRLAPKRR